MTSAPRHSDRVVKICGMRDADNIADVAALTPMLMGFIFYEKSPRYAGDLDPEVVRTLPHYVHPVALFVNESAPRIVLTCERYGIDIVQLHGDESPEFCQSLRDCGLSVFKALNIAGAADLKRAAEYADSVDAFVFDTKADSGVRGGSGQKFDWSVLDCYALPVPYLLSGGIGPDDVDSVIAAMRPMMAGIDINSRFETEPGRKNIASLASFLVKLRNFNEDEQPTVSTFWTQKR